WRVPGISYPASPPEAWSPTVRVSPETVTATMYSTGLLYPANGLYRTTGNFTPGTDPLREGSGSQSIGDLELRVICGAGSGRPFRTPGKRAGAKGSPGGDPHRETDLVGPGQAGSRLPSAADTGLLRPAPGRRPPRPPPSRGS